MAGQVAPIYAKLPKDTGYERFHYVSFDPLLSICLLSNCLIAGCMYVKTAALKVVHRANGCRCNGASYLVRPKRAEAGRMQMLAKKLPLGEGIFSSSHTDKTWAATRKYIAPFFSLPNLR